MDIALISQLFTYVVFAWIGYVLAKRLSLPTKTLDWVMWLLAFILSGWFIQFDVVNIFGFVISSQHLLQGLVLGILINFMFRATQPSISQPKS